MNFTEHEIRKKYRYSNLSYVFDVYMECEYRANLTQEEYDGLLPGEFRFDYKSWERRLGISKKQLVRAIKELTGDNAAIVQTFKGRKGISSKYFLTRFEEQKKEQNEELERKRKGTEINVENTGIEEDRGTEKGIEKEQNEEQKKEHSSQYNNLNIISNKEKGTSIDKIINSYTGNFELRNTLKEFLKMRKSIKKPMTDKAMKLLINKLDKLGSNDNEKIEILNQSIFNSWQGVFELKNKREEVKEEKTIEEKILDMY